MLFEKLGSHPRSTSRLHHTFRFYDETFEFLPRSNTDMNEKTEDNEDLGQVILLEVKSRETEN